MNNRLPRFSPQGLENDGQCSLTQILHQALAIRNRGYTNQVRLRGLAGKLRVLKPAEAGFVCVAPDFQSVGDKVQDLS